MLGLDPAIHHKDWTQLLMVARVKPEHDESGITTFRIIRHSGT
jgi:hypothetical protein